MPIMDECSKTREELLEELHSLRRELTLLKSLHHHAPGMSDCLSQLLLTLVDEMDQFVVQLDLKGNVLEDNRTTFLCGGFQREEILNVPFWTLKCWQVSREGNIRIRR